MRHANQFYDTFMVLFVVFKDLQLQVTIHFHWIERHSVNIVLNISFRWKKKSLEWHEDELPTHFGLD